MGIPEKSTTGLERCMGRGFCQLPTEFSCLVGIEDCSWRVTVDCCKSGCWSFDPSCQFTNFLNGVSESRVSTWRAVAGVGERAEYFSFILLANSRICLLSQGWPSKALLWTFCFRAVSTLRSLPPQGYRVLDHLILVSAAPGLPN